jgi:DNA ligase-1
MPFQPMLSGKAPADLTKIQYPVHVSPKLDGIRAVIHGGQVLSRKLKPIPNRWVQDRLKGLPDGLDGELIVGDPRATDVWNKTQSGVMSADGRPDFRFHVFDDCSEPERPWERRVQYVYENSINPYATYNRVFNIEWVPHTLVFGPDELMEWEAQYVAQGYEGVMLRAPNGPYKFGRSTEREGYLLKMKRFHDAEAEVIGFVERMHNTNEATKDERGYTKRSSAKAGKVPTGTLGALVCRTESGATFELGTGFNDIQRTVFWRDREALLGAVAKFKYQHLTPAGNPLFPVWLGWRNPIDF